MRCAYHPDYYVPLPATHPFPMAKYPRLYERLRAAGWLEERDVIEPVEAALDDLRLVHTDDYLAQLSNGTLDAAAIAQDRRAVVAGAVAAIAARDAGHAGGGTRRAASTGSAPTWPAARTMRLPTTAKASAC